MLSERHRSRPYSISSRLPAHPSCTQPWSLRTSSPHQPARGIRLVTHPARLPPECRHAPLSGTSVRHLGGRILTGSASGSLPSPHTGHVARGHISRPIGRDLLVCGAWRSSPTPPASAGVYPLCGRGRLASLATLQYGQTSLPALQLHRRGPKHLCPRLRSAERSDKSRAHPCSPSRGGVSRSPLGIVAGGGGVGLASRDVTLR